MLQLLRHISDVAVFSLFELTAIWKVAALEMFSLIFAFFLLLLW